MTGGWPSSTLNTWFNDCTVCLHGFMTAWSYLFRGARAFLVLSTLCFHWFFFYSRCFTILVIFITHRNQWFNTTAIASFVPNFWKNFLQAADQIFLWKKVKILIKTTSRCIVLFIEMFPITYFTCFALFKIIFYLLDSRIEKQNSLKMCIALRFITNHSTKTTEIKRIITRLKVWKAL